MVAHLDQLLISSSFLHTGEEIAAKYMMFALLQYYTFICNLSLFFRRWNVGNPPVQPGRAETGAGTRNQRLLAHFGAVIGCRRISEHLARVIVIFEDLSDRFVQSEGVGPCDL